MARIVVPTPNTVIASAWGKTVADALNDVVVQRGQSVMTFTAGLAPVQSFPVAFTGVPIVVANVLDAPFIAAVESASLTATTFRIRGYQNATTAAVGALVVAWIAVGVRA